MKEKDVDLIKEMQQVEEIRRKAVDEGIIDDVTDQLTFADMIDLVVPDDAEPRSRPEGEMSWQNAREHKPKVLEKAGENVSVHEVVSEFTRSYAEEHGLEVDYGRY